MMLSKSSARTAAAENDHGNKVDRDLRQIVMCTITSKMATSLHITRALSVSVAPQTLLLMMRQAPLLMGVR